MDDSTKREELTRIVAERRKALSDYPTLDARVRALSQSGSRHLLPPRPSRKRSTFTAALFAVVGAVALLACVATATAVVASGVWLQGALNDPSTTVQSFYGALQQKDYAHAYSYFTASARSHLSEAAFADQFDSYDALDGAVSSYSLGATKTSASGDGATIVVTVTRRGNASTQQVHTLLLVKENGAWRIQSISIAFRSVAATPAPGS
jgi:Domain of unknown function (DUF4878)